jgi:mono/diheme cytochrome c family protein
VKRVLKWLGILVALALLVAGSYALAQAMAFDKSMAKKYDIPFPKIERSTDPEVIARGKHLAESVAGCAISDCHGSDLGGGKVTDIGPVGKMAAQNLTAAGLGGKYSDGEMARLIIHGVKRDGTGVAMMPVSDFNWLPDDEIQAIISYVRSVPAVERGDRGFQTGLLGKILDRQDKFFIDVARRVDHEHRATGPKPEPTEKYGRYIGRLCQGCHGEHFSGGPIPGAPPSIPIPPNITPDDSGIKAYAYEDFIKLLETGIRKNGKKLDPFMPYEALSKMNDIERQALWAFLRTVEPRPFGGR